MKNSHIEWTDHTFNPWEGCTKVSPGCVNCYAEARNQRFSAGANWGKGAPRRRTSAHNWNEPRRWNEAAERNFLRWQKDPIKETFAGTPIEKRPRVFCASLADWLDDEVPIEWLADLLDLIRLTPNLDWQLLTKRPENWYHRVCGALAHVEGIVEPDGWEGFTETDLGNWLNDWTKTDGTGIPANVWIGTSVEDQARADERIPKLLEIPARVRFLSCEPLLGRVDFLSTGAGTINWVICGGESGHEARPMHPEWARVLRDQCRETGVAFFFKQWGEWLPYDMGPAYMQGFRESRLLGNGITKASGWPVYLVGKKAAGRLLDGREWNEFPQEKKFTI